VARVVAVGGLEDEGGGAAHDNDNGVGALSKGIIKLSASLIF
jgi:hypothetical protein